MNSEYQTPPPDPPSLVVVQPRQTPPCLTERLLIGCKESRPDQLLLQKQSDLDLPH